MITRSGSQEFLQFGHACRLNSSAQSKDNEFPIRRSLNLKHRLGVQRMLEKCKTNTNRKRLKELESVDDKMPTFRKLPKVRDFCRGGLESFEAMRVDLK